MLIAITGTHGTGKTTLTFQLAATYKALGANVKIVQEVARSCPFPLNDQMTYETALWIYYEHSKKELEACRTHDIVICDRTSFDSFMYAKSLYINGLSKQREAAFKHLKDYDSLYFVRPDYKKKPINDGIRSIDIDFQKKIDLLFYENINHIDHIPVNSSQIFNKEQSFGIPAHHYDHFSVARRVS